MVKNDILKPAMLKENLELLELESQNKVFNKLFIQAQDDIAVISNLSELYL